MYDFEYDGIPIKIERILPLNRIPQIKIQEDTDIVLLYCPRDWCIMKAKQYLTKSSILDDYIKEIE